MNCYSPNEGVKSIGRVMEKAKLCLGRNSNTRLQELVEQESRSKILPPAERNTVIYIT
jgi:hypothetical protein